jgi:hypothetical protein
MAASQFNIYSSSDSTGPGLLFGAAGDLLRVLDACLVNGYSGHAAPSPAWTKPVANASNIGSYKPGAGSRMGLVINDNGGNVTSTFKEAWATGWESVTGVGSPVGSGVGQFPTAAQLLTTGHVVVRKSATADSTNGRQWTLFADSYTFYLFINTGDQAATYNGNLFFGDIYSLKGSTDAYRCILVGAAAENSTGLGSMTVNAVDHITTLSTTTGNHPGHYMPRAYTGLSTSVQAIKAGDYSKTTAVTNSPMIGSMQTPNGPDNSFYMSAVTIMELTLSVLRGRMRGMFHICHPLATYSDGQMLPGANDFSGKTIQIVKQGANAGFWGIEVSATVETN